MSRWFRFYDDALNDPKVQRLPGEKFKAWVNLLCLASKHGGALPSLTDIAFALRLTEDKTSALLDEFCKALLLDPVELADAPMSYEPHNWNGRQYKSDVADPTAPDRMKRYRSKKRNDRNATVTVQRPETEQRQTTETDSEQREGEDAPAKAVAPLEEKPKPIHPNWHPNEIDVEAAHSEGLTDAEIDRLAKKFVANYLAKGDKRADWSAQWRSWCIEDGAKKPKAVPDEPVAPVDWDGQIVRFKRGLPWTFRWYGPEPGQAGCRAPPELLAKHGYGQLEKSA